MIGWEKHSKDEEWENCGEECSTQRKDAPNPVTASDHVTNALDGLWDEDEKLFGLKLAADSSDESDAKSGEEAAELCFDSAFLAPPASPEHDKTAKLKQFVWILCKISTSSHFLKVWAQRFFQTMMFADVRRSIVFFFGSVRVTFEGHTLYAKGVLCTSSAGRWSKCNTHVLKDAPRSWLIAGSDCTADDHCNAKDHLKHVPNTSQIRGNGTAPGNAGIPPVLVCFGNEASPLHFADCMWMQSDTSIFCCALLYQSRPVHRL